ncbi:MAG: helix-turn-helix transcriptional regulator [Corallococcus sp.]|nr:helix-turn-helix transcriptional regulator [Corallococcus sp.]
MTLSEYIQSRGIKPYMVTQQMGVSRQYVCGYGKVRMPTVRTLQRIAKAMTDLGVPTTAADVFRAVCSDKNEELNKED